MVMYCVYVCGVFCCIVGYGLELWCIVCVWSYFDMCVVVILLYLENLFVEGGFDVLCFFVFVCVCGCIGVVMCCCFVVCFWVLLI